MPFGGSMFDLEKMKQDNFQAERDDVATWVFTEFTNIFNRPFFHVFGEIFIAETTTHRYYHTEASFLFL